MQYALFDNEPEENPQKLGDSPSEYSNYVVYVDESGDHGMVNVDESFPVFVLAFCIFHKRHYCEQIIPSIEKFKFNFFGHDHVILHENEIRKSKGQFSILNNIERREIFMSNLNGIIQKSNFILASSVIDKKKLKLDKAKNINPYNLALSFCIETLIDFLVEKGQEDLKTHVIFECRGEKEDKDLELEFRRVCDGENKWKKNLPLEIIFAHKRINSSGLQLADLVARPIGINYIRPTQANRSFEMLKEKFFCKGGRAALGRDYENFGLKVYPQP